MEFYIVSKGPIVWTYFQVGLYRKKWKRCMFDFYIEIGKRIIGFSLAFLDRDV